MCWVPPEVGNSLERDRKKKCWEEDQEQTGRKYWSVCPLPYEILAKENREEKIKACVLYCMNTSKGHMRTWRPRKCCWLIYMCLVTSWQTHINLEHWNFLNTKLSCQYFIQQRPVSKLLCNCLYSNTAIILLCSSIWTLKFFKTLATDCSVVSILYNNGLSQSSCTIVCIPIWQLHCSSLLSFWIQQIPTCLVALLLDA